MSKPSRLNTYIALFAGFMFAATIIYRQMLGDDNVALGLGIVAVIALMMAGFLSIRRQRVDYREALIAKPEYRTRDVRGRAVALVGTALVAISFVWLIISFTAFDGSKSPRMMLAGWVILFGLGMLLRFYRELIRLGIMVHLISEDQEK